jgi:transposase-like protein
MSRRLQVLFDEREFEDMQAIARRHGMTVSEWVRQTVRSARRREAGGDVATKLAALRTAMTYSFPTGDIDQMLRETEQGRLGETDSE